MLLVCNKSNKQLEIDDAQEVYLNKLLCSFELDQSYPRLDLYEEILPGDAYAMGQSIKTHIHTGRILESTLANMKIPHVLGPHPKPSHVEALSMTSLVFLTKFSSFFMKAQRGVMISDGSLPFGDHH